MSYWTLSGDVSDSAVGVAGMIVNFGGVFEPYDCSATVAADGTFSLTQEFVGLQSGTATAQTTDSLGRSSNVAATQVVVD